MKKFAIAISVVLSACGGGEVPARFDVLITNGKVYDGHLRPPRETNIGIIEDRIVSMDASANAEAGIVIDASGLVVVPGFIDPHTHAGSDLLKVPENTNINYLTQGVTTVFIGNDGNGIPAREEAVELMTNQGIGTNVGFFAGHGTIREAVMGLENRAPSDDELESMQSLVADEMRAGALGLSTGLFYTPGSFADTTEVVELAKTAAGYGGVYDSHMRDESSYNIGVQGSIRELIEIGEKAKIPVHAAHLKALGRDVWGQSGDIIALVEAARERGVEVTADQYPWQASGTSLGSSLIPGWVRADSREAMFARLDNPDLRDQIHAEMADNLLRRGGEDSLLVTGESEWRTMTLGDIAEQMSVDAVSAAIEVVRGGDPGVASFNMNPSDINALGIQDWVMTGSDGSDGHPRKYATYPKGLRDFVINESLMSMEKFVHRSSGLVADSFSLCDRGYLEVGRIADIAVIDTESYLPLADFENPTRLSTGVIHLLVNGVSVIQDSAPKNVLAGSVIDLQHLDCPR
ncbi:MAG: amidohydrolase family protein [Proteobacteria bacterium]|nr:amidohydrolase family protein [Pseudomonadota bacterium]MDA0992589.1 amidohydrolase family protein [Pseudomonadota bacterium]